METPQLGTVKKLTDKNQYWGEFPEAKLFELTKTLNEKGLDAGRAYAKELGRDDFIFGVTRSNFTQYLGLTKESVVLDCGAGLGIHTFNMAKASKEVHAFDLSLSRMEFCAARAKAESVTNVFFYNSDFANLPFPEGSFDAITMNGVVEWLGVINAHDDPRDDQLAVLRQMYKLLKPGGILYIGIENRISPAYLRGHDHNNLRFTNFYPRWLANIVTKKYKGHDYRTYTYTKSGYDSLLNDSGFSSKIAKYYIAYPGYNLPQYLISYDDKSALQFFTKSMSSGKGITGRLARILIKIPGGWRIVRQSFFAYAIFAKKST